MANLLPYIAFADDDPDDQEMLTDRVLQGYPDIGFKLFKNGEEVSIYLRNCPTPEFPFLLILDYKMPLRTGAEVLMALHNDRRYDPIHKIVWSTSGNYEYVAQCQKYGAEKYFIKPRNIQELDIIVAELSVLLSSPFNGRS